MSDTTTKQSHAYMDLLAAATKACPHREVPGGRCTEEGMYYYYDPTMCVCNGTGTLPRFPSARRKCPCVCLPVWDSTYTTVTYPDWDEEMCNRCFLYGHQKNGRCENDCNGTGEVPDYDAPIEAVMAGLTRAQGRIAVARLTDWLWDSGFGTDPMPSQSEIREAWLRQVCEVAGLLEVAA